MWREVQVKRHWLGIEGGDNFPSLNFQTKVHEDHLLAAFAKDPPETTCIQAGLKFLPVPLISRRIWIMKPYSKAIVNEMTEIQDY